MTLVRESAFEKQNIKLCSVSCVNNCGGGVSVGLPSSGKIVKLRAPSEVLAFLSQSNRDGKFTRESGISSFSRLWGGVKFLEQADIKSVV